MFLPFCLSFSLSLSFAIYLQSYLSSHLPIYLSIHVAIVRSEKTHTLARNEFQVLMCHHAVRKDMSICLSIDQISLSLSLYIYISLSLSVYLSTCLSICLCLYPSISLFALVSNYLSLCLCIYLSISPSYLSIYLSIYLSNYLSIYLYNIRTSKIGSNMWRFVHFDLEMCFAPQWHALFQHPNGFFREQRGSLGIRDF